MKRQLRVGRIILAVLLLSLAGLAFYVWPGVSWKIDDEKAIGFDVSKGLVYTVKSDKRQLRGYDLWSGEQWFSVGLEPGDDMGNLIVSPESLEEKKKDIAKEWKWQLSPNKREVIGINWYTTNIQLVDLAGGKVLRKLTLDKEITFSLANINIGFSRNGNLFAVQCKDRYYIIVWNLTNGEKTDVVNHDKPRFISGNLIITDYLRPEIDLVDGDIAYSKGNKSHILNIVNQKLVCEHPAVGRPRFLDDGQLVIFTPLRIDKEHRPAWYHRDGNGMWQAVPIELASGTSDCEFVSYTDNMLVTDCPSKREANKPEWMPVGAWGWANRLFGFIGARHRLQYWDLHTGQLVREFSFFESTAGFGFNASNLEHRAFVSEDGRWLARESDNELTVCDTLERRSVWCWVVVGGVVGLAFWLAWPRKMKLA